MLLLLHSSRSILPIPARSLRGPRRRAEPLRNQIQGQDRQFFIVYCFRQAMFCLLQLSLSLSVCVCVELCCYSQAFVLIESGFGSGMAGNDWEGRASFKDKKNKYTMLAVSAGGATH